MIINSVYVLWTSSTDHFIYSELVKVSYDVIHSLLMVPLIYFSSCLVVFFFLTLQAPHLYIYFKVIFVMEFTTYDQTSVESQVSLPHGCQFVYPDRLIRTTPPMLLNTWTKTPKYSSVTLAPAYKVGRRRLPSHKPVYRHATIVNLEHQVFDRELPFSASPPAKHFLKKDVYDPYHLDSVDHVPSVSMLKNEHCEPSADDIVGLEQYMKCPFSYLLDTWCGTCCKYANCFKSKIADGPGQCSDCLASFPLVTNCPLPFPKTEFGCVTGTQLHYTGFADVFRCKECNVLLGMWAQDDDPVCEHSRFSPACSGSATCDDSFCCDRRCFAVPLDQTPFCYCCGNTGYCKAACKKFQEHKRWVYSQSPLKFLQQCVSDKILPNFKFAELNDDDGVVYSTITCGDKTVVAAGLTKRSARREAAWRYLLFHPIYPEVHMFALGTLPAQASETLAMADATLGHVNTFLDKHDTALTHLTENVNVKLTDASRDFGGLLPKMKDTMDDVSSTLSSFKALLDKISSWLPAANCDVISLVKDVFVSLFFAMTTKSITPLIHGLVSYSLRTSFFSVHLSALTEWLSTCSFGEPLPDEPEAHGFFEDMMERAPTLDGVRKSAASVYDSVGTGMCIALSGILSFVAIVCLGITDLSTASFNKLLTQSSLVGRALVGVRSFKDVFFGIWDWVDNQVCKVLYGSDRKTLDITKNYPLLTPLLTTFSYFHESQDANELLGCNSSVCELLVKADNLYANYVDKALTLRHHDIVARLKESRLLVKTKIEKANLYLSCGDGARIPPTIIYLMGGAGCGKTELSSLLQKYLSNKYYPDLNQKDAVYSRKSENEFWDGVRHSHGIVVYDDILQVVDSAQKPNTEIFEIIRLGNSDSFQVHIADVKGKSDTYIAPSFVIATSNVDPFTFEPKSIHSVDAFVRRLNIVVEVDIDDNFAKYVQGAHGRRKIASEAKIWHYQNPGKTNRDLREAVENGTYALKTETAVYKLHVTTTLAGRTQRDTYTYEEFLRLIDQCRTLCVGAHSDKTPSAMPAMPDKLQELDAELTPETHGKNDPTYRVFSTTWLGPYDNPIAACAYLNATLPARFCTYNAQFADCYVSDAIIDDCLHRYYSEEDFDVTSFLEDIIGVPWPSEEFVQQLRECHYVNKSLWSKCGERVGKVVSSLKGAWTNVCEFLKANWLPISSLIGAGLLIGGATSIYMCAKNCNVMSLLSEGGSLLQLVGTRACYLSCDLCNRIRKADLTLRIRNRSDGTIILCPDDVRRVARHIVSSAEVCKIPVHPTFILSLCEEKYVVQDEGNDVVTMLESHQDYAIKKPLVESHQDAKLIKPIVESHQEVKLIKPLVESHQDVKLVRPVIESHQDGKIVKPLVESHQDVKIKNPIVEICEVESHQDLRAKQIHVEGNFQSGYSIDWTDIIAESSNDHNAQDISKSILSKNLVRIMKPDSSYYTHGLFVKGRMLLMPKHMYDVLDGYVDIVSIADVNCTRVPVPIVSSTPLYRGGVEIDVVICEMGPSTQARRDITSYFPRKSELSSLSGLLDHGDLRSFTTEFYTFKKKAPLLIPKNSSVRYVKSIDKIVSRNEQQDAYHIREGFECMGHTSRGDCCSPYILFNPSSRAKIMGLHCAGFAGTTRIFAQIVTQEDIATASPQTHAGMVSTEYPLTSTVISPLPNTLVVGSVRAAPPPTKSDIIESPIHGCFPVLTAPAKLYVPGENLMIFNALKVTKNVVCLREDLIDLCVHDVKRVLNTPGVSDAVPRILSHEESITGIEGRQYMNALNRSTSAGFPYSLRKAKGKPGKQTWLGSDEFIVDHPELKEHVELIISKARKGIVDTELGVFTATLKDERRPLAKVEANKTRVFAATNQALALAQRRYFLSYLEHVMLNRVDNEIGLGVNVYSYDWSRIVNKLHHVGSKVIAGDFSNFDGSLNSQLLARVAEIVTDWYDDDEENGLLRHTLTEYLFNACLLIDNTVVQLNHSQPSGNPLTTLINCMYNMLIFRYVYLLAHEENGFPLSLANFSGNLAAVFYGDDSLCCVSDKVCEWFNQHSITRLMAVTGHVYTDETKSGSPPPYRDISEVTFLKREFVKRDSLWIAPLSKNTIEDMCMWSKKNIESQEALRQTTRVASFEASLHGRKYHEQFCGVIRKASRKAGYSESCLHFAECNGFLLAQQERGGAHDSELLSLLLSE
ncbi:non-structural polyprotein [Mud crab virus]|uniref:Non-structural polyprotein n=1 Tax=Mud crab virus TaxID=932662 RepID=E5G7H8_9VIRU|nr:non-structural polyprotein [Mud crab virus]ADR72923.1 non-structural polyprotein [Mud crab virus]